ncbi:LOW QUALITY PROTEIN: hyaluronidase-1-like [Rhincodon typus]|uniref:LOW QUALITY PROTEIN: hyaluronidase-1-like n=1 Tax=Rhincodon typus TaxID=259920 RepID=UPI002030D5D2|nr:LOW QUALITY PROTEIN: hyaluronidase-1-like [Rhincodon typus]
MLPDLSLLTCTLFYLHIYLPIWAKGVKPVSASPMIYNKPFTVIWNTPTARCKSKFNVDLKLNAFDIVANENEIFMGKKMTIFYKIKLGLYPFYTAEGTPVNGGLVQNASLCNHLQVVGDNMTNLMDPNFRGLVVIDWEEWRPLWVRNWGKMDIYRKNSEELAKRKYPHLTESELLLIAKKEYEGAAKNFMTKTLKLGHILRPQACWGFYKYPDCYNYVKKKAQPNYSGHCKEEDIPRNNQLAWLWKASRCLYPSIYIPEKLKSSSYVQKFVHYRIKEALRVAALDPVRGALPVLAYSKYAYIKTLDFLSEIDLVHTIGESAAMGASGVVLWGNNDLSRTKNRCKALKNYIDKKLGIYIINTTTAAILCSRILCNNNGRCVRKNPESKVYLLLDPKSFDIIPTVTSAKFALKARGEFHSEAVKSMKEQFKCHCYKGRMEPDCKKKSKS